MTVNLGVLIKNNLKNLNINSLFQVREMKNMIFKWIILITPKSNFLIKLNYLNWWTLIDKPYDELFELITTWFVIVLIWVLFRVSWRLLST